LSGKGIECILLYSSNSGLASDFLAGHLGTTIRTMHIPRLIVLMRCTVTTGFRTGWNITQHVVMLGNAHSILVGKSHRQRPLRRPRHGWEDNIRINLREVGWEGVDWMYLA